MRFTSGATSPGRCVLAGLAAAAAGYPGGDSIAALFVAALVLIAAGRLIRRNVDVLMDRAPADAEAAARAAIASIEPPVSLSDSASARPLDARLPTSSSPSRPVRRSVKVMRSPTSWRQSSKRPSPAATSSCTSSHGPTRRRSATALCGSMTVPRVSEIHNLSIVSLRGATELSLHLKLPGDLPLDQAHEIAEEVERAIVTFVPEIASVQPHLEPFAEVGPGELVKAAEIEAAAERAAGGPLRELRLLRTEKASSPSSRSDSTQPRPSPKLTRGRARSGAAAPRPA